MRESPQRTPRAQRKTTEERKRHALQRSRRYNGRIYSG